MVKVGSKLMISTKRTSLKSFKEELCHAVGLVGVRSPNSRSISIQVQELLETKSGNDDEFHYWLDNKSTRGI